MRRLLPVVFLVLSVATGPGSALADPKPALQTTQLPPLTTGQIVMNCALSGALFSAVGGLGLFSPTTVSLASKATFALLHEAIYGCGIGVISGYVSQSLLQLIPLPPPPNPGDPSTAVSPQAPPPALAPNRP